MGKPKLTRDLVKRAVSLKGKGLSNKDICTACGISEAAFYRWQEQGGKSDLQKELVDGLKKAESEFKAALLANIMEQGKEKDWKAHAWILERLYPAEFGRVDRLQAEVKQETKAEVAVTHYFDYGEESGDE
jgi:transposase